MTTKAEGKELWRYVWDYENRLTSASTRKQTVRYRYDALGRRVQRYFVGGKENTKFIYDGQDVLVDDNNGVLTKYQNGLGIDNKLKVSTNGTAKYFLTDHLGSTNGLVDASGNLTEQTSYDSFGNATNNLSTRYQFTGREFDNFTGLHYYRARWYDGNLGRFISEDPIGLAGGINTYGYVDNAPLSFRDPSGKLPILIPVIIGATVLIMASPTYLNAPGPGDPIYDSRSTLVGDAFAGFLCGYALRVVGGAIVGAVSSRLSRSGGGGKVVEEVIETGIKNSPKFGPDDFAYGPSGNGKLVEWAEGNGIKTLTNLTKPTNLTWEQFSAQNIEQVAFLGNKIHFDLSFMKDIPGALSGTGPWGSKVTAFELRYIQANWTRLSNSVIFYRNGTVVEAPW